MIDVNASRPISRPRLGLCGRSADLPFWLHRYVWHRPHPSLKYQTPIQSLQLSMNYLVAIHSWRHDTVQSARTNGIAASNQSIPGVVVAGVQRRSHDQDANRLAATFALSI